MVLGGGGRDRAYAQGADPVTLDLTASGIEIAVGITPEDGIAGDTFLNAKRGHMVAGGAAGTITSRSCAAQPGRPRCSGERHLQRHDASARRPVELTAATLPPAATAGS